MGDYLGSLFVAKGDDITPGKMEIISASNGVPGYLKLNSFIDGQAVYLFAQSNKSLRISDTPPTNDTSGNPLVSASSGGNLSFISISCTQSGSDIAASNEDISIFGTQSYVPNTIQFEINNSLQFSSSDYDTITGEINIQQHAYYLISLNLNILTVNSNKRIRVEIKQKQQDSIAYSTLKSYETTLIEASSSENTIVTISELSIGSKIKAVISLIDDTTDIIITTGIGTTMNIYSISDTAGQFVLSDMKSDNVSVNIDSNNNIINYSFPKNAIVNTSNTLDTDTTQSVFQLDANSRMIFKNVNSSNLHQNDAVQLGKVNSSYLYPAVINNELGLYWGNVNLANPYQLKNGNVKFTLETNPINQIKLVTSSDSIGTLFKSNSLFLPNTTKSLSTHNDTDYGILSYDGSSLLLNGSSVVSSAPELTNDGYTGRIIVTNSGIIHNTTISNSHHFNINSDTIFSISHNQIRSYKEIRHRSFNKYLIELVEGSSSYFSGRDVIGDNKYIMFSGKTPLQLDDDYLQAQIHVLNNNDSTYDDISLYVLSDNNKNNCHVQLTLDYDVDGIASQAPNINHMLYVKSIDLHNSILTIRSMGIWGMSSGNYYPNVNWNLTVKNGN